ncbi:MAG: ATP-binding protein [Lentisphaeria bacterium]|nr:ATP-binding protein [Lentisphaeria bacterium]
MISLKTSDPEELVCRGVESDELDYKAAMNWHTMSRTAKGKILRHLTAFANTRGGHLVIGVRENSSGVPDDLTGVSEEEAASFDPTPVGNFINAHIEPPIDFTIDRPLVKGKRFVIFTVRPFTVLPHICSRGVEGELQEGVFYIRTSEASSRPARRALELQEILRRCMRNEREQLGRVLRGILYETKTVPDSGFQSRFSDQSLDAERYFKRRMQASAGEVLLKFFIIPDNVVNLSPEKMAQAVKNAPAVRHQAVFIGENECAGRNAPGSLRMISAGRRMMWQFFRNGLFLAFVYVDHAALNQEYLCRYVAEAVAFAGNLTAELCGGEELLTLKIAIAGTAAPELAHYRAGSNEVTAEINRSAADLLSGRENHAARLVRRLGEGFKLPDSMLDQLEPAVKKFLERR